jgi:UDP-N-acetylglucosamine 2-epimerase (non-hydrolysing)
MGLHVLTVVGARPQFVKAFPVSRELRRRGRETLVHTGQHYDESLSDVFFEELGIPAPEHNLGVGSGSHGRQTAEMLTGLERLVEAVEPDAVLVYGDTNSTLAGALAAAKTGPLLAHVEAGLRSFERGMPEEVNRVLTDHAADLLFAPTETAMANLATEGLDDRAHETGDVMVDTLTWARDRAADASDVLSRLSLDAGAYVLATVHRPRNADDPGRLAAILDALAAAPSPVVLPVHPRTAERLREFGLHERAARELQLVEPQGYLDFVRLLDAAARVVTDSGGVQKEAYLLGTPCVTLREETEWTETLVDGWNVLVGADPDAIRRELHRDPPSSERPRPYGDGNAAERIVDLLVAAGSRATE